jgi:hypothetical protein
MNPGKGIVSIPPMKNTHDAIQDQDQLGPIVRPSNPVQRRRMLDQGQTK